MWHLLHFNDPRSLVKQSIMPTYPGLLRSDMNFEEIQGRVDAMAMLGVPYGEAINAAPEMARAQARQITETILSEANGYDQLRPAIWEKVNGGMPANREEAIESLSNRKVIAIIAYLQRLGVDVSKEGGAP